MKQCTKCLEVKPLDNFRNYSKSKDGKAYQCKDCKKLSDKNDYLTKPKRRNAVKDSRIKNKQQYKQYIIKYLLDHPCIDCGESDIIVLEFDHRSDKKFNICAMNGYGLKKIKEEVAKCDVRCANDHKRKTAKQFNHYKLNYLKISSQKEENG